MSVHCQYNVSMLNQKLYKNGNSIAVTIPKSYLKQLGLRDGSPVVVKAEGTKLIVTHASQGSVTNVDPKFMQMVDSFINRHQDVLAELAKR